LGSVVAVYRFGGRVGVMFRGIPSEGDAGSDRSLSWDIRRIGLSKSQAPDCPTEASAGDGGCTNDRSRKGDAAHSCYGFASAGSNFCS